MIHTRSRLVVVGRVVCASVPKQNKIRHEFWINGVGLWTAEKRTTTSPITHARRGGPISYGPKMCTIGQHSSLSNGTAADGMLVQTRCYNKNNSVPGSMTRTRTRVFFWFSCVRVRHSSYCYTHTHTHKCGSGNRISREIKRRTTICSKTSAALLAIVTVTNEHDGGLM